MADQAGPASLIRPWQNLPPRQLARPWIALTVLAAAAWAITVAQARSMGNGPGTMGLALLPFLALWVVMMAAMMLPSVAPVAVLWTRSISGVSTGLGRVVRMSLFLSGYLLAWAACGAVAFAALAGSGRLLTASPAAAKWLGGRSSSPRASTSSPPGRTGACAGAARRSARSCTTSASRAWAATFASASITGPRASDAAGA